MFQIVEEGNLETKMSKITLHTKERNYNNQGVKKVLSSCPGQVGFSVRQVSFHVHLLNEELWAQARQTRPIGKQILLPWVS